MRLSLFVPQIVVAINCLHNGKFDTKLLMAIVARVKTKDSTHYQRHFQST